MISIIFTSILTLLVLKFIVKLTYIRNKSKVCLVGRTALITGGNSGIGLEVAKDLASRGCTIIIADKDDATNTIKQLIKETNNPNISSKLVDFASFKSVRLFAEELKKSVQKLHILVNNAGIGDFMSFQTTEDGIQKMMQVNYFSHFLLTHELLDLLLISAPSRIIYASSLAAYVADLSEYNFITGQQSSKWRITVTGSYGNSKLAGAIMSKILTDKLENTGVTSNVYHAGFVNTNIMNSIKNMNARMYLWLAITYIFGKSAEEGAQTLMYLSCANEVQNVSGKFFMENISVWQPREVYDNEFCRRIWELSEKYVNLKPEEKLDNIIRRWRMTE